MDEWIYFRDVIYVKKNYNKIKTICKLGWLIKIFLLFQLKTVTIKWVNYWLLSQVSVLSWEDMRWESKIDVIF